MNRATVAASVGVAAVIAGASLLGVQALTGSSSISISPGASWDAAYKAASPGDTITLTAGTYSAQTLFADASKTSPDDVIFQPAQGAAVTVTGDLSLGTTTAAGASHVTFRDFKVTGGLVTRPGTDDVTFERMDAGVLNISGSGALGVKLLRSDIGPWKDAVSHVKQGAQNVLIEGSVFHDFTITDPVKHSECLMIWGGAGRTTIRNSIFRNCTDFDVLVKSPGAREIILENSFFDVPMPGNTATFTCNPNCPRGGNSIRYSGATETYAGSAIRNNIVNGGIGVDCNCVPKTNNVAGVIPLVPPGSTPPPPPPTTTEPPPTTTEPPPTTTEPPPADSLPLTISAQTSTTVTLSWTPVSGLGYRFLSGGVVISRTNDPTRSSVTFARKAGVVLKVQAESPGPFGSVVSP